MGCLCGTSVATAKKTCGRIAVAALAPAPIEVLGLYPRVRRSTFQAPSAFTGRKHTPTFCISV